MPRQEETSPIPQETSYNKKQTRLLFFKVIVVSKMTLSPNSPVTRHRNEESLLLSTVLLHSGNAYFPTASCVKQWVGYWRYCGVKTGSRSLNARLHTHARTHARTHTKGSFPPFFSPLSGRLTELACDSGGFINLKFAKRCCGLLNRLSVLMGCRSSHSLPAQRK